MMAAHKVLSGMKKGSRGSARGRVRPRAGGRCYGEGRGGLLTQHLLKPHKSLQEDAKVYAAQKAISQICGRKIHLAPSKMKASFLVRKSSDHKLSQSESAFGKHQYLLVLSLRSACRTCYWRLSETGQQARQPFALLILDFYVSLATSTFHI